MCDADSKRAKSSSMQDVQEVEIDEDGTFKYVLLRLESTAAGERHSRLLVRGSRRAAYHRDILEQAKESDADADSQVDLELSLLSGVQNAAGIYVCTQPYDIHSLRLCYELMPDAGDATWRGQDSGGCTEEDHRYLWLFFCI